jgi:DNA polymerase III subunit epsilon
VNGSQDTYLKRVNPGILIPPWVTELIGIKNEDVKDAPRFKEIAQEVFDFLGDSDLGGFNVARFDLPLLQRELFDAGLKFEWRNRTVYDAQKIYHIHERRDLKAAYKFYCNKELLNAHSAMGDSEATLEILAAQVDKYSGNDIASFKNIDYGQPSDYFDREKRFRWWNGELYPMFGKYARKIHLRKLADKDPQYLNWVAEADFSAQVKELARQALEGKFPDGSHKRDS